MGKGLIDRGGVRICNLKCGVRWCVRCVGVVVIRLLLVIVVKVDRNMGVFV